MNTKKKKIECGCLCRKGNGEMELMRKIIVLYNNIMKILKIQVYIFLRKMNTYN